MDSRTQRLALRALRDALVVGLALGTAVGYLVRKAGWA